MEMVVIESGAITHHSERKQRVELQIPHINLTLPGAPEQAPPDTEIVPRDYIMLMTWAMPGYRMIPTNKTSGTVVVYMSPKGYRHWRKRIAKAAGMTLRQADRDAKRKFDQLRESRKKHIETLKRKLAEVPKIPR